VDRKILYSEQDRTESDQQVEDERQDGARSANPEDPVDCGFDHDQSAGVALNFASISLILGFCSLLGVSFRPPALQPAKINRRF
jgi:hypothetical protein